MYVLDPPNARDVVKMVEDRVAALAEAPGHLETVTVEWRGHPRSVPVISMPVDLLTYNPGTHRVRAQRSLDAGRDRELDREPFGADGQSYLHQLLMGDPSTPSKIDPTFEALKEDLHQHGQTEPGIITRAGVLINGNTRRAALKVLGQEHMRVGVLPADASLDDLQSIELSLQLRKDYKRDYSFMNFLLAIDERVAAGRPAAEIQRDFRIKATTFERSRWILAFVQETIERSKVPGTEGRSVSMRLVDFEIHQGKLEELYTAYMKLKKQSPDEAEALREQRLLAIALGKSKTDVRLIDADFNERFMKVTLPTEPGAAQPPIKIPGTTITAAAPSQNVQALRAFTTSILRDRAIELSPELVTPEASALASTSLKKLDVALNTGLTRAGKSNRIIKKRFEAADRLSDANESLALTLFAVADARATNNFDPEDLDEVLIALKEHLLKLAQLITRGSDTTSEGVNWLKAVASMPEPNA